MSEVVFEGSGRIVGITGQFLPILRVREFWTLRWRSCPVSVMTTGLSSGIKPFARVDSGFNTMLK